MNIKKLLPFYKRNIIIAIPIMLSQAGQVLVQQIDCMMLGAVGIEELAAASFANSIYIVGLVFIMGFSLGLTPLVGQISDRKGKIGSLLKNSFIINTIICLLLIVIMYIISLFMYNMNQEENIVRLAIPYYRIMLISSFPFILFLSFKQFFEGIGNTVIAMLITLVANVINVILNYLLIFGNHGFPQLGIEGAAYATLISRIIMPIIFLIVLLLNKKYNIYLHLAIKAKICLAEIKTLIRIGFPISGQIVVEVSAFSASGIMMGWISTQALAAHQIALGLATLSFMIASGIGSATTIRISHQFRNKNTTDLKMAAKASVHMVLLFMGSMALIFIIFRHQLPLIYTSDIDVINISASLLILTAIFQVFDGVQLTILGILRGLADVKHASMYSFISFIIISIPTSYTLAFTFNFGSTGVWTGLIIGLMCAAIMYYYRLMVVYKNITSK